MINYFKCVKITDGCSNVMLTHNMLTIRDPSESWKKQHKQLR